jgi:hypothetical protein
MNPILSAGVLIGVLCGVWMFVMGFTGWYRDPALLNLFFLVILIELGGLYWGLRQTAAQGRGYGQQVLAGTGIALVAGVIVFGSSLLFTTVAFPGYFQELEALQRQQLEAGGMSVADIEAAIEANAAMSTPVLNALTGFIATVITGIVGSAVIAFFVKGAPKAPAAPARV